MTCIVGVAHDDIVTIGGDSIGVTNDGVRIIREDRKVWSVGRWAFGACGSFRMLQLLRYGLTPDDFDLGDDPDRFMVGKFVDHVRDAFEEGGWLATNGQGQHTGGTFMVGFYDRLYVMHADFQIERAAVPYAAIGSGREVALGAMFAADLDQPVRVQIRAALAGAAYHRSDVAGPFHLVDTAPSGRGRQDIVRRLAHTA